MRSETITALAVFLGVAVGLISLSLFCPARAVGQTAGNNAVYTSSGNCSPSFPCASSPAFIDASVFVTSPPPISQTFCGVLNYVLVHIVQPTYPFGAVIDARGLNSGNTSMTCTSTNPSPWSGITSPPPSTILLPATKVNHPISIPSMWTLPSNTHLIGEGNTVSSSTTISTTIQAQSSFLGSSIIQFASSLCFPPGSSSSTCTGISVENLTLDGQGQSIDGILNAYSGDQSYVDHVLLYQILGIGLSVSGAATNSGPYSNITFDTGNETSISSTVCAQIYASGTRGIHGLSCTSDSHVPQAAVLLDASNTSIEDVRIVGFYDGIRVGANANAQSNVLRNIIGDTILTAVSITPIIVIHITDLGNTVSDLSIMGANNAGGASGTITIADDLTGAQLTDTSVGIYALGNTGTGSYYSRFTTSPSVASWVVGPSAPSGSCAEGSLYSCIGTAGNGSGCSNSGTLPPYYALWACAYTGGHALVWQPVI